MHDVVRAGGGLELRWSLRHGARVGGQTEVHDAHRAVAGHHHVLRFEVAVHEARFMGCRQPLSGRGEHVSYGAPGPCLGREPAGQRLALHELHGHEHALAASGVGGGTGVVHGDDVGMMEAGNGLGLAEQSFTRRTGALAHGVAFVQQLQGDAAVELRVVRGVDLAHPPSPHQPQDHVTADRGTGCQLRIRSRRRGLVRCRQRFRGCAGARRRRHPGRAGRAIGEVRLGLESSGRLEAAVYEREHGVFVEAGHAGHAVSHTRMCGKFLRARLPADPAVAPYCGS